jgi:hypothetical protein
MTTTFIVTSSVLLPSSGLEDREQLGAENEHRRKRFCSPPGKSPVREARASGVRCAARGSAASGASRAIRPGRCKLGYLPEATENREREIVNMTMYLSNRDIRPTGYEAGEFIEPDVVPPPPEPSLAIDADPEDGASE